MIKVPAGLNFTKQHEWFSIKGKIATVGITDHAQNAMGDVVYIDFSEINKQFNEGEIIASIESVKAVSDVYAPLAGKLIEINQTLSKEPELLNQHCYTKGWMLQIKFTEKPKEAILNTEEYKKFISDL